MSKLFQRPWRDGLRAAIAKESERVDDPEVGLSAPAALHLLDCADALTTIALAAGLGADATAEEVAARVGEMARTLSLIGTWRHEHGAALKPSRADTYGDGMRDAKQQVGAILSRLAEESGRG